MLVPTVEVLGLDADLSRVSFLVPTFGMPLGAAGLPALRVVQTLSAGTDWIEGDLPAGVVLCNARGARDVAMAEWVVGALLAGHRAAEGRG